MDSTHKADGSVCRGVQCMQVLHCNLSTLFASLQCVQRSTVSMRRDCGCKTNRLTCFQLARLLLCYCLVPAMSARTEFDSRLQVPTIYKSSGRVFLQFLLWFWCFLRSHSWSILNDVNTTNNYSVYIFACSHFIIDPSWSTVDSVDSRDHKLPGLHPTIFQRPHLLQSP